MNRKIFRYSGIVLQDGVFSGRFTTYAPLCSSREKTRGYFNRLANGWGGFPLGVDYFSVFLKPDNSDDFELNIAVEKDKLRFEFYFIKFLDYDIRKDLNFKAMRLLFRSINFVRDAKFTDNEKIRKQALESMRPYVKDVAIKLIPKSVVIRHLGVPGYRPLIISEPKFGDRIYLESDYQGIYSWIKMLTPTSLTLSVATTGGYDSMKSVIDKVRITAHRRLIQMGWRIDSCWGLRQSTYINLNAKVHTRKVYGIQMKYQPW